MVLEGDEQALIERDASFGCFPVQRIVGTLYIHFVHERFHDPFEILPGNHEHFRMLATERRHAWQELLVKPPRILVTALLGWGGRRAWEHRQHRFLEMCHVPTELIGEMLRFDDRPHRGVWEAQIAGAVKDR